MSERDIIGESPLRRLLETYKKHKRPDGCCTAISPIGIIEAYAWYSVAYSRDELCSGNLSFRDLKKFLKIRGFPDSEETPIVYDKGIYITHKAAAVPVRSKTAVPARSGEKKDWKRSQYHYVEVLNIPKKDATKHEKNSFIRNLIVRCPCGGNPISHIMSPLNYKQLPDGRFSYMDSIVDLHGSVALLHLSLTQEFWDGDIWGFNPMPVKVAEFIIKRQLIVGKRIDNTMMNTHILETAPSLFKPLDRRIYLR